MAPAHLGQLAALWPHWTGDQLQVLESYLTALPMLPQMILVAILAILARCWLEAKTATATGNRIKSIETLTDPQVSATYCNWGRSIHLRIHPMGFYLRKSVKVGPFRFNLSKSGVGVSVGARGFRFGINPRGSYVHAGIGGLYYRKTISSQSARPSHPQRKPATLAQLPENGAPLASGDEYLQEIESASASVMSDSSAVELLAEMSDKRKKFRLWPLALFCGMMLMTLAWAASAPVAVCVLIIVLTAIGSYVVY